MHEIMGHDLGMAADEVHAAARTVLDFWFNELSDEQHFTKDAELDARIAARFSQLRAALLSSGAVAWRDSPDSILAAIIVLDQFSRNIYRGQSAAFAADSLALELARHAIGRGWDNAMTPRQRQFLYMPLMHAEDAGVQAESVRMFESLGDEEVIAFARAHRDVIQRFGRFPGRNAALGRESTPEERDYLSRPDAGW